MHGLFPAVLMFEARYFEQQVNVGSLELVLAHLAHLHYLAFATHRDDTQVPTGSGRQMMGTQAHGLLQLCLSVSLSLFLCYLCFESSEGSPDVQQLQHARAHAAMHRRCAAAAAATYHWCLAGAE